MIQKPCLPYPTDALAPVLGEPEVRAHFEINHVGYYDRAMSLCRKEKRQKLTKDERSVYKFNLNGNDLHQLWWDNLMPFVPGRRPRVPRMVLDAFGGDARTLKREIVDTGSGVRGSGWVALVWNKDHQAALVIQVSNHSFKWGALCPLLLIDVWEHAYLPCWWGNRHGYLDEVLDKLVNWDVVAERLEACR